MLLNKEQTRQLQLIELDILKAFIGICEQLDLRYYVVGGTLLGAVRHKGFIPWDDDIDVAMPRKDYDIFLEKAPEMLPKHLFLQCHHTEAGYYRNSAKLRHNETAYIETIIQHMDIHHGIFIDVFALDHYPATAGAKRRLQFRSKLISSSITRKCGWNSEENTIKKLLKLPLDLLYPTMYKAVSAQEKLYKSVPHSGLLVNYCGAWGEREIMPEEWFGEPETLEFDGVTVCVPKEYDKCLSQLYGNYMQLPPVEKQVTHHQTEIIDLNRSYREYMKK